MADAMVTGRMPEQKKHQGLRVLKRSDMSASQAVNLLFDRLIEEGDASFLREKTSRVDQGAWARAASFVDSLSRERPSRFDGMTKAEIKADRLRSRGLM